ncbi:hypothetical protein DSCO28_70840 [Desulfosarcina ovata subsp. sediminis]|uniref:Peptidase S8/S53 domain-containing protein n=1 Tax=Desulfosarcina ovata subsp. sediminis TaxID=885957 RepID=A0A5K8A2A4_9BACT|nr:thrombospondin type 3 repeat-containing protein [Desulfosarcina ovata]BBO86518.1 hypothetical protein DSCO28_70840 [Desulfosarcina ovata subsp. sediminis]
MAYLAVAWALLALSPGISWADWKTDIGYDVLVEELGDALPNGTGLSACQVEAAVTVDDETTWMPDPDNTAFSGKTLNDKSGAPDGIYSSHATSVGKLLYGDATSMAPGIDDIDVYYAGHWLSYGYLYYGYSRQPAHSVCRVANHSWVGSGLDDDAETSALLRRLDWAVDRDEFVQTVGLTNSSSTTRPLLSSAFNVIAVGRTDGSHSRGCSAVDELYTADRTRPDLVAPRTTTSAATPVAGSAVALLIQAGHDGPTLSTDPVQTSVSNRAGTTIYNAERAEVIRAALAAGADRFTMNTTSADIVDYRLDEGNQSDNGLDVRYGAGQLNIYNSYHIIAAGEQNSQEDGGSDGVETSGFDYDPEFGGADKSNDAATYTLTADAAHNLLTVALVWHVRIDGGSGYAFDGTATLYDLDLELYDITAGEVVAESVGSGDNRENLWVALVPGQSYEIRVKPGSDQEAFSWDYALAWTTRADSDQDLIPDDVDNCRLTANRKQTDSDGDGYGNRCDCDLDNNGVVNSNDYWRWRLFTTIDPQSEYWIEAIDFDEDGVSSYGDYIIFLNRCGDTAPFE